MSVIVDGKNEKGVRVSVSLPDLQFALFAALVGSDKNARSEIREYIKLNMVSGAIQDTILFRIARPSLVEKVTGPEG